MAVYYVDLDGTICETPGMDYADAEPIWAAIEEVRRLKRAGHDVVLWSARGTMTGEDWTELTRRQLKRWDLLEGRDYDHLSVGEKPAWDYVIDDRAISAREWHDDLDLDSYGYG